MKRQDGTRAPLGWRVVAGFATLLALAVLAVTIAHWTWRVIAPESPRASTLAIPDQPPDLGAAGALFGAPGASANAANVVVPSADAGGTRLLGVFAEPNGGGYALLRLPGRGAVLVASGSEISPGVVIDAVTPSGIRISDRGEMRELALRAAPPLSTATVARPSAPAAAVASACARAGYRGPVYRLNAELLAGLEQKPEAWRDLFQPGPNGLAVREGHAFGPMLGMRPGDRVVSANGVALTNADDVRVAVLRPLMSNQPVELAGVRDGKPLTWLFVNAGACPG